MTTTGFEHGLPKGGVKICGIREPRHAVAAVEAGADMLGFAFAPSRRRVTIEEAEACIEAVRDTRAAMVGLFVNATAEEINRTTRVARLDAVQLHGNITLDLIRAIEVPVIQVLRPNADEARSSLNPLQPVFSRLMGLSAGTSVPRDPDTSASDGPTAYMIDAVVPGSHGGTGVLADWTLAASLARELPLMLAGGLNAANVAHAIREVNPRAVDVSSGVETDGVKDETKIRAFIEAAKAAFAAS